MTKLEVRMTNYEVSTISPPCAAIKGEIKRGATAMSSFTLRTSSLVLRHSSVASLSCFLAGAPLGGFGFFGQLKFDHARTDFLLRNARKLAPLSADHGLRSCLELSCTLGGDDDVAELAVNGSYLVCQIIYLQRFG